MNPEDEVPGTPTESESQPSSGLSSALSAPEVAPEPAETRFLKWALFGSQGLRVGWSAALFMVLTLLIMIVLGTVISAFVHSVLHTKLGEFSAISSIIGGAVQFLGILGAATACAFIERRRILDYNLRSPRPWLHFFTGLAAGIAALSALVGALYAGHWLHFGPVALSGVQIFQYGGLWGIAFLFTGLTEEGSVRCYLQFTLTRGINYWWAVGTVAAMCLSGLLFQKSEGIWGVYLISALGVLPCFLLHRSKSPSAGFWHAAWVTSTFFGFIHTGNNGENWIGIFSAAAIGFVFCVSIRLTGSAWWAIGFHAAWDWAQTFFYGTADSGFQPKGHYLTTSPVGSPFWSGGNDGPEGSVLVIPVVLLTLLALILIYGRRTRAETVSAAAQPQLS